MLALIVSCQVILVYFEDDEDANGKTRHRRVPVEHIIFEKDVRIAAVGHRGGGAAGGGGPHRMSGSGARRGNQARQSRTCFSAISLIPSTCSFRSLPLWACIFRSFALYLSCLRSNVSISSKFDINRLLLTPHLVGTDENT